MLYADAAQVAHAGDDGHHLSLDSHARLAELFASTVLPALKGRARMPSDTLHEGGFEPGATHARTD